MVGGEAPQCRRERDIDRGKWQPLQSGDPLLTTNVCYQDQLNASKNAEYNRESTSSSLKTRPFDGLEPLWYSGVSSGGASCAKAHSRRVSRSHVCRRPRRIRESINDQFSNSREILRPTVDWPHAPQHLHSSNFTRSEKDISWRATKKNISGNSVYGAFTTAHGIWMNAFLLKESRSSFRWRS